ncbi:periplakin-like [Triticum urartu]|uniref:periplakin-like n=1 Tax=Triticum urartu TaxID=4572 RepID=UPI0020448B09|nr:periplakin-like [Triticum urartu]
MGKGKNKKKKAPAAAASSHVAVNSDEPQQVDSASASGDAIQPPMPTPVGDDEPPPESAAIPNGEHAAPPPVEAADGVESPVDSAAAANRDPSTPTVGDEMPPDSAAPADANSPPSIEAANSGEPSAKTGSEDQVPEERRDSSPEHEVENLKSLNGTLLKEAVEARGVVATLTAQVDQCSADAAALADLEHVVFRAALVAPLQAAAEHGTALRGHLADAQQSLQVAEARVARKTDARVEAAARLEEAEVDTLKVEEFLRRKQVEAASASENVTQLESSVGELAGKSTELCAGKGELQKQLGEMSATAHSVSALKAEVEGNFHDYKKSTEIWRQEMKEKLDEKSKQLDSLISSEAEMEVKIQSLEAKLSAAQARNREMELEIETSKAELDAAQKEVENLQIEVANATSKYNTVVADVDSFRNEINEMRKTNEAAAAAFATEKTKLEKELDGLKRRVEKIQANKDAAMASVHQKDAEAAKLMAKLTALNGTIADQRVHCDDLKNKYSSLLAEKVVLLKAFGKEKSEGDKLRLNLGELESYNAEKDRDIGVLKAEALNKERQIGSLNGKLEELHLAVAEARQRGKSSAWTWLCPTTTVLAAASFVYAARSR